MENCNRIFCLLLVLLLISSFASSALSTEKVDVLHGYLTGQAEMGKAAAALLTAQAALVKSVSEAQMNQAKAIETMETTRAKVLENDLKAATNYYEKKKLYDAYQALQRERERPTREDLIRYSREAAPERPAEFQLSRGVIQWPGILQREEFLDERIQLDALFAKRQFAARQAGSEVSHEVQTAANQMRGKLRDMVATLSPTDYVAARKFIDSLAYEAQLPPDAPGVAVR